MGPEYLWWTGMWIVPVLRPHVCGSAAREALITLVLACGGGRGNGEKYAPGGRAKGYNQVQPIGLWAPRAGRLDWLSTSGVVSAVNSAIFDRYADTPGKGKCLVTVSRGRISTNRLYGF